MEIIRTEEELTNGLIQALIKNHKENHLERYNKLYRYYKGQTDILERKNEKNTGNKPNNTLVNNFSGYIVDIIRGYFVGKPVTYSSQNEEYLSELMEIFIANHEQDENSELAGIMGIHGRAYEIVYADANNQLRFNEIFPQQCIMVYNNNIIPEPRFAIRYYEINNIMDNNSKTHIEVYTEDEIISLEEVKREGQEAQLIEVGREEHYFGEVPVIEYPNNEERMGDFEKEISLIDAYDNAASNKLNDLDYFSDAYMYLVGYLGSEKEDIKDMKDNRIILLKEKGEAGFLVKPSNNADSEAIQDRLQNDIHKFSFVPDLSDEKFSSNVSGVAMEYKHFGLDQIVSNKERKFKTGLMKRIRLITTYINHLKNTNYDPNEIKITFNRNKPINEKERVEMVNILKDIISTQSSIDLLPMIENSQEEMERIAMEKDPYADAIKNDIDTDYILKSLEEQARHDRERQGDIND